MGAFFNYFYDLMTFIFGHVWTIIKTAFLEFIGIFDFKYYSKLLNSYKAEFGAGGWVLAIFANICFIVIAALLIWLLIRLIKRMLTFKQPMRDNERMKDEIARLNHEVMKINYEKDKILAMQVSNLGLEVNKDFISDSEDASDTEGIQNKEEVQEASDGSKEFEVDMDNRFNRLTAIDLMYNSKDYAPPEYNDDITLEDICKDFRNFAASKLSLYYELDLIKYFIAALGTSKMVILQGISGTGKTSLPYAFGQFIMKPSVICPVQPAWRDRTELFGYFNEFTKKFNETEFMQTIYEASYYDDVRFIVLDEMNIARVEYYFAEMLSVLEMPRIEERNISIVSSVWKDDPKKLNEGKLFISPNVWYIGTINNDDSTFAVADKVYDRAIPLDLDSKAARFDAPNTEPMHLRYNHLNEMFEKAKEKYPMSEENRAKLEEVDSYIIKHFRLTFGNRILKQIYDFIPCYVACGGSEIDGIDFMLAQKILRKFSSLNLGYIRDEIDGFISYLNELFGYENMSICKEYLLRIKKMM